eukprot:6198462-Pleurochrysis_carterae.AAC.2
MGPRGKFSVPPQPTKRNRSSPQPTKEVTSHEQFSKCRDCGEESTQGTATFAHSCSLVHSLRTKSLDQLPQFRLLHCIRSNASHFSTARASHRAQFVELEVFGGKPPPSLWARVRVTFDEKKTSALAGNLCAGGKSLRLRELSGSARTKLYRFTKLVYVSAQKFEWQSTAPSHHLAWILKHARSLLAGDPSRGGK